MDGEASVRGSSWVLRGRHVPNGPMKTNRGAGRRRTGSIGSKSPNLASVPSILGRTYSTKATNPQKIAGCNIELERLKFSTASDSRILDFKLGIKQ